MTFGSSLVRSVHFVEDLILELSWCSTKLNFNDKKIIDSFTDHLCRGNGLTVKQGDLAVKLCRKYRADLLIIHGNVVDLILAGPTFKSPLRESLRSVSQIKIVKDPKKYISVTFPFNEKLVEKIKKFKSANKNDWAEWDAGTKEWKFSLTEGSIYWIGQSLVTEDFKVDEQFIDFYDKISEICQNMEDYAPMLSIENDTPVFKNVHEDLPQPASDNILQALLLAKKYGIEVWDDKCEKFINSGEIGPLTRKFIYKEFASELAVKAEMHPIEDWDQLLTNVSAAMIVIPLDNELPYLKKWHTHLKSLGFTENQMTVMFRTDNITNRAFNEYVRDNKINTPLSDDIKFVFVSRRIKKPLIKSGITFDVVITCDNLGNNEAMRKILNDKYNAIVYHDKLKDKDFV